MKQKTSLLLVLVIASLLVFEVYAIVVGYPESVGSQAENVGNFDRIRTGLEESQPADNKFCFAVIGESRGSDTFAALCEELRADNPAFLVVPGDFVESPTLADHRHFQYQCTHELREPFPMLLIAGKHDVVYDNSRKVVDGVSPADFEEMYGPANFSFEYGGCLFIGLCILPKPYPTQQSIDFLESTLKKRHKDNQTVFVFTHMPVVMSGGPVSGSFEAMDRFIEIVDRYKVNYVISSHYRGWKRSEYGNTIYLVTGGGGAPLDASEQFGGRNHGILLTVDNGVVSEKMVFVSHQPRETAGSIRYFAVTGLFPFIRRHVSFAIVETALMVALMCVLLWNAVGRQEVVQL